MTNYRKKVEETILTRRREFDDVYVAEEVKVYRPDFAPPRTAHKLQGRQWLASATMVVLLAASTGLTYGHLPGTGAFFVDTELSAGNSLVAAMLDFVSGPAPEAQKVAPGQPAVDVPVSVAPEPDSVPMHYRVTVAQTGGEPTLCEALFVTTASPFAYSGPLMALNGLAFVPPSLTLSVNLPDPVPGLPVDAPCTFDVVVRSWHADVPESTGYTDEERIPVTVIDPPAEAVAEVVVEAVAVVEDEPVVEEDVVEEEPPVEEEPVEEIVAEEEVVEEEVVVEEEPATEPAGDQI